MKELNDYQTRELVNLLAKATINYYKLVGSGASVEECTQCNKGIKEIQEELDSRRNIEEKNIFKRPVLSEPLEYSH
jgi:hypothetical protein